MVSGSALFLVHKQGGEGCRPPGSRERKVWTQRAWGRAAQRGSPQRIETSGGVSRKALPPTPGTLEMKPATPSCALTCAWPCAKSFPRGHSTSSSTTLESRFCNVPILWMSTPRPGEVQRHVQDRQEVDVGPRHCVGLRE